MAVVQINTKSRTKNGENQYAPKVGVQLLRPRETLGMGFAGRQSPPSKNS